jgi:hypothetical protein
MKYLLVVAMLFCSAVCGCDNKPDWKLWKEGEVAKVEYLQGNFSESPKTIIYFTDGSTCALHYSWSVPYKNIKLYYDTQETRYKFEEIN